MLRFLRFLWKMFVLASAFGIGYIIGREHSFEEDEEWENEENDSENKDKEKDAGNTAPPVAPVVDGPEKPVTIEYTDIKATHVSVVGDFNDWNKDKSPMTLENGVWTVTLNLKPGKYEYKLVLNHTDWITDPKCGETVADKVGGRSSVVEVR
ncbi:MAG: isoamylase early set domain-containing protein [Candidatus Ozemobacteraceae bacterium]